MADKVRPSDEKVQANIKKWNIPQPERMYSVLIHCTTYNHGPYIEDALKGFVMQKTSFPFCAIIVDDCSTDNAPEIIKRYAEQYPEIIKPILLGDNHMQHGLLRDPYFEAWHKSAKYRAECEGDDYWVDSLKLQKQYDFMESHPECSMCFHANLRLYPSGKMVEYHPNPIKSFYDIEDVILGGGSFMATNSRFYRSSFLNNVHRPNYWIISPVGDLPAMLYYATKGSIGYIDEVMSVYRVQAKGSWSSSQNSLNKRRKHLNAISKMFDEFDNYTNYSYHKTIKKKKRINAINYWKDVLKTVLLYDKIVEFFKKR